MIAPPASPMPQRAVSGSNRLNTHVVRRGRNDIGMSHPDDQLPVKSAAAATRYAGAVDNCNCFESLQCAQPASRSRIPRRSRMITASCEGQSGQPEAPSHPIRHNGIIATCQSAVSRSRAKIRLAGARSAALESGTADTTQLRNGDANQCVQPTDSRRAGSGPSSSNCGPQPLRSGRCNRGCPYFSSPRETLISDTWRPARRSVTAPMPRSKPTAGYTIPRMRPPSTRIMLPVM